MDYNQSKSWKWLESQRQKLVIRKLKVSDKDKRFILARELLYHEAWMHGFEQGWKEARK